MKILVIEDNIELNNVITDMLKQNNYTCESCVDFITADEKLHLYEYDVMVVDINLPDGSGLNLIKTLKALNPSTGIIVISARNSLDNKIEGLDLGADDYISKPFDMAELNARIKSIIRRKHFGGANTIEFGNVVANLSTQTIYINNNSLVLTKSEYNIFLFFLSNPNRVLTKESIAEHIWGDSMDLADSFDFIYSHIKNIRKKVKEAKAENIIEAVYGIGYKFVPPTV